MMPKAIPTQYRFVQFRSRLEARWAAFFDLLGWPWEYEPIDLDGYIPDFILTFPYAHILVEVKPAMTPEDLEPAWCLAKKAGWLGEIVAVGARLFPDPWSGDDDTVGIGVWEVGHWDFPVVIQWADYAERRMEMGAVLGLATVLRCGTCGHYVLFDTTGLWVCRFEGCGGKIYSEGRFCNAGFDHQRLWAIAGNRTQWRGVHYAHS